MGWLLLSYPAACLLFQAPIQTDASPALSLRASTLQPYVGQVVRLTLELDVPAGRPGEEWRVQIPWLTREFGFIWETPPQRWPEQFATQGDGIRVYINERPQPISVPSRLSGAR
jgi:hypothetical protein